MMKKTLALLLASVLCVSLAACGGGSAPTAPDNNNEPASDNTSAKTLRMAFNQAEAHPQFQTMLKFSENFKAATDGRYDIKLFPNETLGSQRETLEQVQAGALDMSIVNNTHPGSLSDYYKTFDMPFVFLSVDEAMAFLTSDNAVVAEVKQSVEQHGIHIATYFPAGTRSMYTAKNAVHSVDDMKGMKIRTMESDVYIKMMDYFGGNATPMAMGELYTAIQSGVVDGAENNEITYVNSKHYEVAPYWSQTNHLIVPDWLIINQGLYDSFSPEDRAAFDEQCKIAAEQVSILWEAEVKTLMDTLDTSKVTITTDVDVQSFQDAVLPLHDELTSQNADIKKVYDALQEYRQSN